MDSVGKSEPLARRDRLLLTGFCLLLFGYSMVGGRPLTMHEGVLPQSSREMLADGDWIIPKSGGRPWLERPPLPQWITVTVATLVGRCDREWVVRLAPTLMGTYVVLLVAWMAAGWFGRAIGLMSGFVLATMFEFVSYAWLAEEDIFLCAIVTSAVALFAYLEFFRDGDRSTESRRFLGKRPWPVLAFFVVLGMTNLAKGLLFGTVMASVSIAAFLVWNGELGRIARYAWLWGWLAFAAVSIAWPVAAYLRYPDVLDLWLFDHLGRLNGAYTAITEPWWHYLATLPEQTAPWTLFALLGLGLTARAAFRGRRSPERFLWCWGVVTVVVFSLPSGKHHHYLVQCLAPWGILAAIGVVRAWDQIRRRRLARGVLLAGPLVVGILVAVPLWFLATRFAGFTLTPLALGVGAIGCAAGFSWALQRKDGRLAAGAVLAGVVGVYGWIHTAVLPQLDQCRQDTVFLEQVPGITRPDLPLLANADLGTMDLFRILFYLDENVLALHDLSFLVDERIRGDEAYVITRQRDESTLREVGEPTMLLRSEHTRRERAPSDRLTLYHLRYYDDVARGPVRRRISPMEAMNR